MIAVVLMTHGTFGQEILHTAADIVGRQEQTAGLAVTAANGPDDLGKSIDQVLESLASPDGFLFLVDMLGGTPCNMATLKTKNVRAEIVTGVNLYMTLSAFRNRTSMELEALAAKVAEDGRRAIVLPKELLKKKLGPI
jgi:mannose PTS system EIIA component